MGHPEVNAIVLSENANAIMIGSISLNTAVLRPAMHWFFRDCSLFRPVASVSEFTDIEETSIVVGRWRIGRGG